VPIIPSSPVAIPNQVGPTQGNLPYVQARPYSGMIGTVQSWNPDATAQCGGWLNEAARVIYDRKTWYGLFLKGQIVCPQATTLGTATVTLNSPTVVGSNGTAWTAALIGQQFRIGYNNPIYTIIDVDPIGQTLTLELPWGGPSSTNGYFIVQYYYNIGSNIKYLKTAVNMQLGYKMRLHLTQDWLNSRDPWRQNQNFPWGISPMPVDSDGNYLIELYPVPWIQQALPFMAYVQPPNLVSDNDSLPAYIRCDIVEKFAIARALVWRGPKLNKYYDAAQSRIFMAEFEQELVNMANADENLYRTQVTLMGEDYPYYDSGGATWQSQHAVMAGGGQGEW